LLSERADWPLRIWVTQVFYRLPVFEESKKGPPTVDRFAELPVVTVQLPLFNEIYVVERLLKSVSELDYPRDRLQIQVLDDSTDETREIAASCVRRLGERGLMWT
jgi:cellulose synthase/poly-beta-1,6-N-acetylglucosamine synthase-like glycosyltransferase